MIRHLPAVLAFLLAVVPAAAQTQELPVIVTTVQAEVKRAADRAWVSINAESRSKDAKEAQRMNVAAMEAVMAQLRKMNLGDDAIRTTGYDLHPEFDYANGRQTLRGYVARNSIEVRIDDVARVGDVLGAAVGSGATTVGGLRFDLKDRDAAEREALRLAVAECIGRWGRLDILHNNVGISVQHVEEQRMSSPEPPRPMMRMTAAEAVQSNAPPITPGTIEIRSVVTMTVLIR